MSHKLSRRSFLQRGTAASLLLAGAGGWRLEAQAPAFPRQGEPRLLLSLAAYSFRDFFAEATHARETTPEPEQQLDLFDFIDFCGRHGCQGAELTSYYFPRETNPDYLLRLKRHAILSGVAISGGAVGNSFTLAPGRERERNLRMVKQWIDRCQLLGAPHLRVFAGSREGTTHREAQDRCVEALEECCAYAGEKGVMLGLENHGGIVAEAEGLLEIIHRVNHPWLGINLDTGNFVTDDPYGDLERCVPWAVNVQLKVEMRRRNRPKEPADLERVVGILRQSRYQGYVALEYEAAKDPWREVPRWLDTLRELFQREASRERS